MRYLSVVRARPEPVAGRAKRDAKAAAPGAKHRGFTARLDLSAPGVKAYTEVKDGDRVTDYRDVRIKGYLATFGTPLAMDRQGEYIEKGAFLDTLPRFMANSALFISHRNEVERLAGSFEKVNEDEKGLYVEAVLSNSPADWMKDVRWKVAEGHLRSLSIGGIFHYKEDGRGIFRVDLHEGSLTPVPANPDAVFSVRSLTPDEERALSRN